jgi:flagellar basal body-associated protein FliL
VVVTAIAIVAIPAPVIVVSTVVIAIVVVAVIVVVVIVVVVIVIGRPRRLAVIRIPPVTLPRHRGRAGQQGHQKNPNCSAFHEISYNTTLDQTCGAV